MLVALNAKWHLYKNKEKLNRSSRYYFEHFPWEKIPICLAFLHILQSKALALGLHYIFKMLMYSPACKGQMACLSALAQWCWYLYEARLHRAAEAHDKSQPPQAVPQLWRHQPPHPCRCRGAWFWHSLQSFE